VPKHSTKTSPTRGTIRRSSTIGKDALGTEEPLEIRLGSWNVFEDVGFPPDTASVLRVRSDLLDQLLAHIQKRRLTAARAARVLGVDRSVLTDLKRGRLHKFRIEKLVRLLHRLGFMVNVCTSPIPATAVKRKGKYRSAASAAIHDTARVLRDVGAISKATMREFDASCLVRPSNGPPQSDGMRPCKNRRP